MFIDFRYDTINDTNKHAKLVFCLYILARLHQFLSVYTSVEMFNVF